MSTEAASPDNAFAGMGVLEKAMALLNIISTKRAPMTFTDLLRASAFPKATLHRIVNTLVREGLLRYDGYNKTFQLGFRLLQLAHEVWSDFDLRVASQDDMLKLRDALGESVQLAVLSGTDIVIAGNEEAGREGRPQSKVGVRLPVHATAAGKAIAAYLDPVRQKALLDTLALTRFTERTLIDLDQLRSDLDLTRARGYAIDDGEHVAGSVAIAVPIFDFEGQPIGAVGVTGSSGKLDAARAHSMSTALIGAARSISHSAVGEGMSITPQSEPAHPAATTVEVQCVTHTPSLLGEGPMWSPRDNALYWVDILTPSVHRFNAADGDNTEFKLGSMVSVAIPKSTGGLLVATPGGLMTLSLADKRMTMLAHPEAERPGNRYNDGKCDRRGRLWIASMDMGTAANRGNLFRVDADGSWKKMDSGFTVPNGLGWSPDDKRMYFTDTFRKTIYVYDFDLMSGSISNRRALITFAANDGKPDGLTVDEDGCLWVAVWDAWQVARYSPDGREIQRIRMPVPRPTSCCFGGPSLETLYVTTASVRLSEAALTAAPLSGSLFAMNIPGVRGLPEATFAG
ncbi:SMP-30/gluconolactonase/LRE family protein [soil metagenome]